MVGWGKMHNVDLMIFQGVDADTMLVKIDRGIRHMHTIIDLSNLWVTRLSFIDIQSFFGLYRGITPAMWKVLAVVWSILVVVFAAMWALDKKYNVRFQTTVGDIEDKIDLRHEEIRKKREAKKAERKAKKSL